jgi:hypothetical protein
MADTLPISRRSGVARLPLDPTDVVPGPQPLDLSERNGHHVIVGEVVPSGRHRAPKTRRRVAVSGALLSAAGAFVTLALMVNHHSGGNVSAGARVTPSSPLPDLGDEPTAAQQTVHEPGESAAPHTAAPAGPAATTRHPTVAVPHGTSYAGQARQTGWMRRDATASAAAWANAMRSAAGSEQRDGGNQAATAAAYRAAAARQSAARQSENGQWQQRGHDGRGGERQHGGYGRGR